MTNPYLLILIMTFIIHNETHRPMLSAPLLYVFALDSLGGPFPSTSHRCHHKPKRCLPIQYGAAGGPFAISPLLFHPNAKGSQIIMDLAQKTVKRQASFCNAITFSNRPIALYEQVRLKVFCVWVQIVILSFWGAFNIAQISYKVIWRSGLQDITNT